MADGYVVNGETKEKVAVHSFQIEAVLTAVKELQVQVKELDTKLDGRLPDCVAHGLRLAEVEKKVDGLQHTVQVRTWESRASAGIANVLAIVAGVLAKQ